jgi:hypothetical protein
MSRRGARLTVAVLFALSIGAAAWQYLRVERAVASERDHLQAFDREARAIAMAVADLRASQQAYVAAGQGAEYWTKRVGGIVESLAPRLADLRRRAESPEAGVRLDSAVAALEDFARMDRRAREYALQGQLLLASDLVFAEGLEMTRALAAELHGARSGEISLRSGRVRERENQKALLSGGVALVGLLFMLLLALAGSRRDERKPEVATVDRLVTPPGPPVSAASTTPQAIEAESFARIEPASAAPRVKLREAADLCLDLARVTDTEQIPTLLDRAATVLDASGIVLWIADPDGRELVPTSAHGYPAAAIARVGTIRRDSDNATAAAFREARVHVVKGDVMTNGAIAVPLVTPGGCVGVMAAEVRHEREQTEETRALAAIVAAQLATLIGVSPPAVVQPQARAT